MTYRAEIEIAVKGSRQVDELKNKVNQLNEAIEKIRGANFQAGSEARRLSAFAVAQEQKLLSSRRKYNQELRESITRAVQFQRKIESTLRLLKEARESSSRILTGSAQPVGLLQSVADSARSRRQRLASRALPAAGQTSNPFFAAQQSAKVIDEQNAAQARLNKVYKRRARAERKAATAAEGVIDVQVKVIDSGRNFTRASEDLANSTSDLNRERVRQVRQARRQRRLEQKALPFAPGTQFNAPIGPERAPNNLFGQFSPIRGSENLPGSPRFLQARSRRRADVASNALIGGAFPLLFGQGAGASLGGALGGGIGGLAGGQFGFGGSLVGTFLGQTVDQIVAQAQEAGQALNSTGTALDFVREKSLFSSEQTEQRAAKLEELGRVEELANLLTSELVSLIGNNGVEALQELGRTTDKTTELWNELTLQLSALIAGPLNGFLSIVNQLLGRVTTGFRFNALLNDLEPEQRQKAESRLTELTQRVGTGRSAAKRQETEGITTTEAQKKVIEEFAKLVPQTAKIPVTVEDRKRFTVTGGSRSRKGADNASRAAAELARLEAQISSEKVRQIDLDIRKSRITLGEVELIKKQSKSNKQRLELTVETINKQRSQALARNKFKENEDAINKLYDSRVKTAKDQVDISEKENNRRLELLNIEREISKERRQRQFDQQLQGVDRDIERTRIQLQSPFGGEEQQRQLLSLDQSTRREDAAQASSNTIKDYNNQISKLNKNDDRNRAILEEKIRAEELFQEKLQSRLQVQDQLEQQQLRQNQLIEKFGFISDEVATAISSSVQAIITGTGSVQEAFSNLFQNIGRAFVDLASQVLAQKAFLAVLNLFNPGSSLFSSGSSGFNLNGFGSLAPDAFSGASGFLKGVDFFANGGNPPVNRPSIVGERGPELFVPRTSGTVVSNDALEALSRYRPENSAQRSNQTVNVNYNVTEVNGMRFVTEDQFRAGLDQAAKNGAKMGQSMTISTLKNSRSQRSKIGL